MTCRRMTPEEIARADAARADAACRQWWLPVLTAGIIPRPEPQPEPEPEIA